MRFSMFVFFALMMLGVLHFAEETKGAPQEMGEEENQPAEVETRGLAEEEDVGEADEAEAEEEAEARNQQSPGNARGIITGPRIVVGAFRKVFKKPSDT